MGGHIHYLISIINEFSAQDNTLNYFWFFSESRCTLSM
jgi:hypothetical protein